MPLRHIAPILALLGAPALPDTDLQVLVTEHTSGITTSTRRVVETDGQWRDTWAEHTRNRIPPPPRPSVDFTRRSVLVAASGPRESTGHWIRLARAVPTPDGGVRVVVEIGFPNPAATHASMRTTPVAMASVPRPAGPVTWEEVEVR